MPLGTGPRPVIPRFRHIIVHIDNEWAIFTPQTPDALSTNLLANSVEKAAFRDDSHVIQFHSSFGYLDKKDMALNLAKSVGDTVVLDCWPCGTSPMVWIAPFSKHELDPALTVIRALRCEFPEDALDIVLLHEGVQTPRGKFEVPSWQESWHNSGRFAHCGSPKAVASVLRHVTQSAADSERVMTRAQGQRRLWASKEFMRQDVVRYEGGSCFHPSRRKGDLVDTIRFYNREKPWYEFTNFFQGAGFSWEPTLERFSTVEHFFQAMKTTDPTERIKITRAASARDALKIARNSMSMKWFWEQQCSCGDLFKERVMFMALMQKFSADEPRLRVLLLSTGTCQLNEVSPVDSFWGSGEDGKGKNRLGFLLERVRTAVLREEFLRRRGLDCYECRFAERWH
ncbi:hypothetical protein BGZ59_008979 [Podila verticillata]|nr:hypothetical protein BGZ59_008979 [Podila verticillata]KFH68541.1 hypothetical protein MVEG_05354 [Podila verticillata NRRL 6337]